MIPEALQEQAALHVMGLLPPAEEQAFQEDLKRSTQLQKFVTELHLATLALASDVPLQKLPPEHRQRLMQHLLANRPITAPKPPRRILSLVGRTVPWAAAAGLAVLLSQKHTAWQQTQGSLKSTNDALQASNQAVSKAQEQINALTQLQAQTQSKLTATQQDQQRLLAEVSQLKEQDFLAKAQIAVMGSLIKTQPKAVAVSVWNQEKQNGLLVVENLPKLPVGKDYQLWVIDPTIAAPVSAGVFQVDEQGKVRIQFKPNQPITTPGKFAVTEEILGGAESPTMDKMVVIGGL